MGMLDGRVAVITGGASGIGARTVRAFVDEGARVVIADVQDELGRSLANEFGKAALYQHTDVSLEEDVRSGIECALGGFGRLDCMFNNAGILGTVGPLEDIPVSEYDHTMNVLLRSVFLGMKYASPVTRSRARAASSARLAWPA